MPTGVYIRTEETREKTRQARLGQYWSDEIKKRLSKSRLERKVKLGFINSPETRLKISEAKRGHQQSEECKQKRSLSLMGNKNSLGYKHSLEIRQKQSESHKGEKAPNWRGGVTPLNMIIRKSLESRLWREAVFERDNWTCQKCGENSGDGKAIYLEAHHIKSFNEFPELRFTIDNGKTLCTECHRQTDSWGFRGKGKNK